MEKKVERTKDTILRDIFSRQNTEETEKRTGREREIKQTGKILE